MEGSSIDFLRLLNSDLSLKILSILDDPSDVVRVASVSHTWRQFVIASGFSKSLCLRLFPETSSAIKAIEENNVIECLGFNTTGSVDVEQLKKNHRVYAFLASGLAPSLTTDCIVEAISASSTDHFPEENIRHTLEPREIVDGMLSYWSSMGESNPEMHETLTFKLVSKLCFITEINIQPSQELFEDDFPIFSAKAVQFRMGRVREPQQERFLLGDYKAGRRSIEDHVVWTYTSEKFPMVQENRLQKFKLPEPVLAIGGLLQIELFGGVQLDWDDLYYLCVSYVQVVGRPLTNEFVADLIDNSGKCVLKYNRKEAIGNDSDASEDDLAVLGVSCAFTDLVLSHNMSEYHF
ncbi:F-box protein At4g00755-like [Papaver somniferum]|uniref:F-box protein At4g00755-like n=1 Tax=Papaver somniferum TaxID=3469 RepID=UPI000E6F724D|nr:F-box protein At4g00755-like [Papaver somniferum]